MLAAPGIGGGKRIASKWRLCKNFRSVDASPAIYGKTDARYEIIIQKECHGLSNIFGLSLTLDQGGLDGLPALGRRHVRRQQYGAWKNAIDPHRRISSSQ